MHHIFQVTPEVGGHQHRHEGRRDQVQECWLSLLSPDVEGKSSVGGGQSQHVTSQFNWSIRLEETLKSVHLVIAGGITDKESRQRNVAVAEQGKCPGLPRLGSMRAMGKISCVEPPVATFFITLEGQDMVSMREWCVVDWRRQSPAKR